MQRQVRVRLQTYVHRSGSLVPGRRERPGSALSVGGWGKQQAALKGKNVLQAWGKRGSERRGVAEYQMSHGRDADS